MAIYRSLVNLDNGKGQQIARGEIFTGVDLPERVTGRLLELGKISPVSAPPLAVLPGWKSRARKLAKANITDAGQFLETPVDDLSEMMKASPDLVSRWKAEITGWLIVPPSPGRG